MWLSRCDSSILAIKCGTGEGDKKRVSCCVALEMCHRAGVVPGIKANPMWFLKSKSTQVRVFSSFPLDTYVNVEAVERMGAKVGVFILFDVRCSIEAWAGRHPSWQQQ